MRLKNGYLPCACARMEMSMVDAILRAQKLYYYWVGVGSDKGACPSPDYRNKFMFVPTQHPIFTPGPDNV